MNPYINDSDFQLYVGDVRDVLAELVPESVHCVVTSPPYWGLRDYGAPGQLGLEPTPEEYVANMVDVFRGVRRVLRADGTVWCNLGDTYNAIVGAGFNANARIGQQDTRGQTSLAPKNLVGIPWRVAFALQADGWYLRSDIIWSKPNPMPESVTDRPTKAHEYVFLLTRSPRYFFDADAVREGLADPLRQSDGYDNTWSNQPNHGGAGNAHIPGGYKRPASGFRNLRSVWEIATEPYPDAHFATFPQALVEPCVKAGTSEKGCCPECGAPWMRVVEKGEPVLNAWSAKGAAQYDDAIGGMRGTSLEEGSTLKHVVPRETVDWEPNEACNCFVEGHNLYHAPPPVPCTVLDPFLGSGTTALVARKHGRRSIGIELSPEYAKLAANRLSQLSLLAEPA